jgi:hypothetical protein
MNKTNVFVWLEIFKNISIFIAFNIPIIATKSTIEYVNERFFFIAISSTWLSEQVSRKSRHFMFVSPPQYGLIFLKCIWIQFKL